MLGAIASLTGCAARSQGRAMAADALQCEHLEPVFPTPHRYMTERSADLYKGCGRYALVRCMLDANRTVCVVEEVVTEADAQRAR